MKKGFSIALSILMLAATLHLSFATHYCGGQEISMKISLSGKLAECRITDCGMDGSENEIPPSGTNITKHCCDDIVTVCLINSNYSPTYSFVPVSFQNNFQVLAIPLELSPKSQTYNNLLYSNVSPPGALMSTNVDLSDICVFRI